MKLRTTLFVVIHFLMAQSGVLLSQSDVWFVGNNIKIDFTSGTPTVSNGIAADFSGLLNESSTSVSDGNGNPLIVVLGAQVFDGGANQVATLPSFTEDVADGSLLFPVPGKPNYYYLTVLREGTFHGTKAPMAFYYEVIVNGLGAGNLTINGSMNLDSNLYQGQAGVSKLKMDGTESNEYWLLTHEKCNNHFVSYSVDEHGISKSLVSSAGSELLCDTANSIIHNIGTLKFNSCQDRFAMTNNSDVQYFAFDRKTGAVTFLDSVQDLDNGLYGLEFSPDGGHLYISSGTSNNHGGRLYSVPLTNLSMGTPKDMGKTGGMRGGHLQLAPDGNIYFAVPTGFGPAGDGFIGRITDPNAGGVKDSIWYEAKSENWNTPESEAQLVGMSLPRLIKPVVNDFFFGSENCGVATSLQEASEKKLYLFPNPTAYALNIIDYPEGANYQIIDIDGRVVMTGAVKGTVQINHLSSGTYFFQVRNERYKIIKL